MSLKKTPNAFAKFTAAVHRGVDLRDKRDAALKAAAAALATLEATMESDTATRDDFDAAKVEYEETVVVLVDPIIRVCGQPYSRSNNSKVSWPRLPGFVSMSANTNPDNAGATPHQHPCPLNCALQYACHRRICAGSLLARFR